MPESVSRLVIVVDAKDGKKEVDALDKSLGNAEKQGDKTAKSIKNVGQETGKTTDLFSKFKEQINSSLGNTRIGSVIGDVTEKVAALRGGALIAGAALTGMAVGGAAVAFAGLSAMAIQAAKADAEMIVLANRANTSTQNFQILSHAAEQLGMSQDGLAQSLADAQEKLGEFTASGGGGEAADFFDAIKNNTKMTDAEIQKFAKTLQGKDGVEALQLMKDKLDSVGASAQEQRFVFESLGNDLGNLLPLFENGGALLDRYGEALTEAGIIKSKEAIEQSRLLAAQTKSVQTRFEGFKTQLASQMMPVLNSLLSSFLQGAEDGGQFGSVIQSVGVIAKGVAVGIIGLASAIQVVIRLIQGFVEQAKNIGSTAVNVWNADGVVAKGQALVNGFKNGWSIASDTVNDSVATIKGSMKSMNDVLDASVPKLDKLGQLYYDTSGAIDKTNKGLKTNAKEAKDAENAAKKAAQESKKHAQELEKINEERLKIQYEYSDKSKQIEMDLQKEIERLQKYGMTQYVSVAIQKANDAKLISDAQLAYDLYSFKMNEQEKLTAQARINTLKIKASSEYSEEEKTSRLKALKAQYDYDLAEFKKNEKRKRDEAWATVQALSGALEEARVNAVSKASLSPLMQSRFDLNSAQQRGYSQIGDDLNSGLNAINENEYLDEQQKYSARLALFEQFLAARKALNEQYSKEDRALQDQNNAATLAGYGAMFGMMGAMLDNFGAKSSGAYKAAFALQKGFVLASAILNAKGAILAAWNDPSNTTIWQKMAAAAATAVQTNELMSAIQGVALSGFANGGQIRGAGTNTSDSIPIMASHEEFMIKAKSAKKIGLDNLNYMNRTGELPNREMNQYNAINSGGSLERTVSSSGQPVTIQVYVTDSGVSTNGANTQDQKQLGQMIGNAVRTIIRQEQRQGGLLSK
ncbi:hypothetical protein [Acinetobacter baumannii]|uniref:hypothetical protein n=1 Tax=Acinetobacter baumannii TaxID=470 RepID=UPI00264704EC|nr:hypothetical protein [Acinetobacter baumannii]MCZ2939016.1 hypothetical protein [Acinetobacter baumannii]MDQ9000388.1 hypothetical protein [Acinetobacter baumannii]MDQ9003859.1 hypothetical protein [Acinetobacter baumannii]